MAHLTVILRAVGIQYVNIPDVGRCLTLNASYEPVALVPIKRALVLVVSEKAEVIEANLERRFRSEKAEYPYPLVIRLVKFVEIPRRLRKHVTNAILFARDNYKCQYCGKHRDDLGRRDRLTRDHVKPLSRGGTNTWDNVVTVCNSRGLNEVQRRYVEQFYGEGNLATKGNLATT